MRRFAIATLIAIPLLASSPRPASAQWIVVDPSNLAQAIADYAMQGLQYAEALTTVRNLVRQVAQLDSTYTHMKDAANGRIGQLSAAFSALSSADASLLLDADFGAWRNRLEGGAGDLAEALEDMDGSSLSDFLIAQLDAADVVTDAQLLGLYPGNATLGAAVVDTRTRAREGGDRIRAADFATAEAGGRLFALLEDAQTDIDGRRGQGELSHTALQQAQIANQLTAAEIEFARVQLLAIQAQQDALARHEAELQARAELARWVQREQAALIRSRTYRNAEAGRSDGYRDAFRLRRTP